SVAAFDEADLVDEILVMMTPGWSMQAANALGSRSLPMRILDGGTTRSDSTELALEAIDNDEALVVIHDAARPLIEPRIIDECVRALNEYQAVGVVVPSADTIVEVDAAGQ